MNNSLGKLIVFEGVDGAGKTTQAKLLVKYLQKKKIPCAYISFPRYEESLWGKMVRRYLAGDFGEVNDVDPYFASMLYAGDRLSAADQIKKWLSDGKVVVCNRYVGSNMAHMGGKVESPSFVRQGRTSDGKQNEKIKFIKWLEDLEYGENKIPKEDLVIFLHVPVQVSRNLIKDRKLDIHEKDLDYLEKVIQVYKKLAKSKNYWERINCTASGKILEPYEIHRKVLEVLKKRKILSESTNQFVLRLSSTDIVIDVDEGIKGVKR